MLTSRSLPSRPNSRPYPYKLLIKQQPQFSRGYDTPLLLTIEHSAKLVGIGRTSAYALVKSREWKTIKIGRLTRLTRLHFSAVQKPGSKLMSFLRWCSCEAAMNSLSMTLFAMVTFMVTLALTGNKKAPRKGLFEPKTWWTVMGSNHRPAD
jgi:hypothetical protein